MTRTVLGALVIWALACGAAAADDLHAGAARVDITPPTGFPMWGYGARHDKPSDGVLDPLHARALVLAAGKTRIAVVSLDLGRAPTRDITEAVRQRVKKAADIDQIFLVASHTHHGPVLELDSWPDPKKPYIRDLEDKLVGIITDAAKQLRPAMLGLAAKEVPFNRNRHTKFNDKPVDRELIVVRVVGADGKPIAHLVNFAAHAVMQDNKILKFSADYPGVMSGVVEKETGAPCLFLQGAAGDLSVNAGEHKGMDAFGKALGKLVLETSGTVKPAIGKDLMLQTRWETFKFGSRVNLGDPAVKAAYSKAFFPELIAAYEREYKDGIRPQLTTALLDDKIALVGVSGEFFCTHSLLLKKRSRLDHVLFLGYCNDYQQYFPTIEAAAEGGYGADSTVSPVEVGAGERIMDRALIHLYEMRGKLKGTAAK
jgi:hypothetical protein